jgi:hypothetical protein
MFPERHEGEVVNGSAGFVCHDVIDFAVEELRS